MIVQGWRIWLEHHARTDDREFELPQTPEHRQLYRLGEVLPTQNSDRLALRIRDQLSSQLNDNYLAQAQQLFLRLIPLSDEVMADPSKERVVVPIRLREIKATSDSLLGVRLKANEEEYGKIVMKASSRVVEDGNLKGCVRGRIHQFEVPPIDDLDLPTWWDDRLPDVLSQTHTKEVYMHEYFLDLAARTETTGGLVIEPDE